MLKKSVMGTEKLPGSIVLLIILLCILPFSLNQLGFDFSSHSISLPDIHEDLIIDDLFYRLSGAFAYTILEWSAFSAALITAAMGLVNFRVVRDLRVAVISVALLCAGSMDAFQTLAADRLIGSVADNRNLIPFTWAISRIFKALIILIGVSLCLIDPDRSRKNDFRFIILSSVLFIFLAFAIIQYCASRTDLPETMFPGSWLTRPWDVAPLILYTLGGATLIRRFNQQNPSIFTHALLISMIPETVVELHMAFGSTALFDNHFNIAHFIKIFAYLVPLMGLIFEYIQTYTRLELVNQQLAESESKANAIIDNAIDGLVTIDANGLILSFNPAAEKIFGYQKQEVMHKNVKLLMPSPYHEQHDSYLHNYLTSGVRKIIGTGRKVEGQRKDGSTFPLELGVAEVSLNSGTFFTGFLRDVSERSEMENALHSREQLFRTIINSAPVMIWMLDKEGIPILFNDTWLDFSGRNFQDEINSTWSGKNIHPSDRERILDHYQSAIQKHTKFDHEFRLQHHDSQYHWIREIGVPNFDHNNEYQGFIGICVDISSGKNTEQQLKDYTVELERSNTELEQFAYIASHDLQEPLRMVSSYTQLLARRYQDKLDADALEFIAYAVDGANRMQRLIQDLLAYSRVGKSKQILKSVDANEILDHVLKNLKLAISESNAKIHFPDSLPKVSADATQFEQLLQNLIANAIKYRAENRECEINIQCKKISMMWQFSVADNGIGIEAEYFERIFMIFKRLHGNDKFSGTGLGLAVCKRIVEGHGGKLWLESEPGKGSTFYFTMAADSENT